MISKPLIHTALLGSLIFVLFISLFPDESHAQEETLESLKTELESLKTELEKNEGNVPFELILAVLAIITAGGTGLFNYFFSKKQKEHDAYTDYVYEARKNLYEKCAPILFQYSELAESALYKIKGLARHAKNGNLGTNRNYLSPSSYFLKSTLYRLMIPHAAFRILQRQLTQFDLNIDQKIKNQYRLAKILYYTLTSDDDLANSEPTIEYDRERNTLLKKNLSGKEYENELDKHPEKYMTQCIFVQILDKLTESLTEREQNGEWRLLTYAEFEKKYFEPPEIVFEEIKAPLFDWFHLVKNINPKTRPVFWRILLAQAYLFEAILKIRTENVETLDFETFKQISKIEKKSFDWRQAEDNVSDEDFTKSFTAVENYIRSRLITQQE